MQITTTRPNSQRRVVFDNVVNFRDLGGLPVASGRRIARGKLFRSATLAFASDLDLVRLRNLGIRNVIDLRSADELAQQGRADSIRLRASFHHVPILGQLWDPAMFDMAVDPVIFLASRYDEMLEYCGPKFVDAVETLARSPHPTVFHCTAGKDRTGILAALILGLLGVADHEIVADYESTTQEMHSLFSLLRSVNPLFEERMNSQPAAFLASPAEAMSRTLTGLRWNDGNAEAYLLRHGLPKSVLRELRTRLLEDHR